MKKCEVGNHGWKGCRSSAVLHWDLNWDERGKGVIVSEQLKKTMDDLMYDWEK